MISPVSKNQARVTFEDTLLTVQPVVPRNSRLSRTSGETSFNGSSSILGGRSDSGQFRQGSSSFRVQRRATLGSAQAPSELKRRTSCPGGVCRFIVDSKIFVALTTTLTIYALVGDDIRKIATQKPADDYFTYVMIVCLFVFLLEIILSSIGRTNYVFSFFFYLDIVSTLSLVLDIPLFIYPILDVLGVWTGDATSANSGSARTGRTARVGAKAGRVVRVMRLVRILKLYKAYYSRKSHEKRDQDQDDWGEDEEDEKEELKRDGTQESRVGKKLSELTIRRVIILVLTMLLVVPLLEMPAEDDTYSSAYYGGDEVTDAYNYWRSTLLDGSSNKTIKDHRKNYERTLLTYINYHDWYDSASLTSNIFWIGMQSVTLADFPQEVLESTQLHPNVIIEWRQEFPGAFTTTPTQVIDTLGSPWVTGCGAGLAGISMVQNVIPNVAPFARPCPQTLRNSEYRCYAGDLINSTGFFWNFYFCFDQQSSSQGESGFGLGTTCLICTVLLIATSVFSNDANRLLLNPLEIMIKRVQEIAADPLVAMKMADRAFKLEEVKKAKASRLSRIRGRYRCIALMQRCFLQFTSRPTSAETMETVVLEKTIIKLGSLLALGFGQAGANIIAHNIAASHSAGVKVMIPGNRVDCIIGVIRVANFKTVIGVLQEDIMTFMNQIAEIVHGVFDECLGAATKNDGDTFLMVWRVGNQDVPAESKSRLADFSMLAVAKIYGAVHRSRALDFYKTHPGLRKKLGEKRCVSVSCSLHAGWAIEGTVGTEFKVDASYVSPNVSIATSIESATRAYDVPALVSQMVIEAASRAMAVKCRLVDNVIIKGSLHPLKLYSLDLDPTNLILDPPRDPSINWNSRARFKVRQFLEHEKGRHASKDFKIVGAFNTGEDIRIMRRPFTLEFTELFNMGYQNYSLGEWRVARRLLLDTSKMLGVEDGPSAALLRFMEGYDFNAPPTWTGVRELPVHRQTSYRKGSAEDPQGLVKVH